MALKKKNNSRKALAVALGIMGVAGLSLASASQLTVNTTSSNIGVGQGTFAAACDTAVDVAYTYSLPTNLYSAVNITGIAAACNGKTLQYTLKDTATPTPATIATGTLTISGTSATFPIATTPLSTTLGTIDIAIY